MNFFLLSHPVNCCLVNVPQMFHFIEDPNLSVNLKGSQQQSIVDPSSDASGTLALSSDEQRYCQN